MPISPGLVMFGQVRIGQVIKGTDPFLGVIFYLWTDPAEINTEYVKLKKNTFCS